MAAGRSVTMTGANGIALATTSAGRGPLVVLLHGGGQTRFSWSQTVDRLALAGMSALAVDQRGHGESDWVPQGDYDLADFRDDVTALLAQLPEAPAIVGASLGGAAALLALGEEPSGGIGRASCLVLVDVVPRMETAGVARIRQFMASAPDGFASLDEAAEAIARYRPGRPRPRSLEGLAKNLRLHADNRYRWHWDPRIMDGFRDTEDERHRMLAEAARGVAIPTLLVRGAHSDVVGEQGTRELASLIPHVEVAEIADAGHMVAGDSNDPFSEQIVAFVRRHSAGSGAASVAAERRGTDQ